MEPMCLGNSPKAPSSPGTNPNFLPPILLGGESQPMSPNPNGRLSPVNKSMSVRINSPTHLEPKNLRQKLFNQSIDESNNITSFSPYGNVNIDKGPPKKGLFDTLNTSRLLPAVSSPIGNSTMQYNHLEQPSFNVSDNSLITNDSVNYSCNANMTHQNYQQKQQYRNMNAGPHQQQPQQERPGFVWVTVFGFPPSAASLVLAQFSNFGTIVEKQFPTQGNWVNIKYSNQFEAAKALTMDGKLISNSIMIAVTPYNTNNGRDNMNKENMEDGNFARPTRARSLRHSFVTPHVSSSCDDVVQPQNVPEKSTGIVSKAMEYFLGW